MTSAITSLEDIIRSAKHALVIGVGGGGDVRRSSSLDEAAQSNAAFRALGIAAELDYERKFYQAALTK